MPKYCRTLLPSVDLLLLLLPISKQKLKQTRMRTRPLTLHFTLVLLPRFCKTTVCATRVVLVSACVCVNLVKKQTEFGGNDTNRVLQLRARLRHSDSCNSGLCVYVHSQVSLAAPLLLEDDELRREFAIESTRPACASQSQSPSPTQTQACSALNETKRNETAFRKLLNSAGLPLLDLVVTA